MHESYFLTITYKWHYRLLEVTESPWPSTKFSVNQVTPFKTTVFYWKKRPGRLFSLSTFNGCSRRGRRLLEAWALNVFSINKKKRKKEHCSNVIQYISWGEGGGTGPIRGWAIANDVFGHEVGNLFE